MSQCHSDLFLFLTEMESPLLKIPKDLIGLIREYLNVKYEVINEYSPTVFGDSTLTITYGDCRTILSLRYFYAKHGESNFEEFLGKFDKGEDCVLRMTTSDLTYLEWSAKERLMEVTKMGTVTFSAGGRTALKIIDWIRRINNSAPVGQIVTNE